MAEIYSFPSALASPKKMAASPATVVLDAKCRLIKKLQSTLATKQEQILYLEADIKEKEKCLHNKDNLISKQEKEIFKLSAIKYEVEDLKKMEMLAQNQEEEIIRLRNEPKKNEMLQNTLNLFEKEINVLKDERSELQTKIAKGQDEIAYCNAVLVKYELQLKEAETALKTLEIKNLQLQQENRELVQNLEFVQQNYEEVKVLLKEHLTMKENNEDEVDTVFDEIQQQEIEQLKKLSDELAKEKEEMERNLLITQKECETLRSSLLNAERMFLSSEEMNCFVETKMEEFLDASKETRNEISCIIKNMIDTVISLERRLAVLVKEMEAVKRREIESLVLKEEKEKLTDVMEHLSSEMDKMNLANEELSSNVSVLVLQNQSLESEVKIESEKIVNAEEEIRRLKEIISRDKEEMNNYGDLEELYNMKVKILNRQEKMQSALNCSLIYLETFSRKLSLIQNKECNFLTKIDINLLEVNNILNWITDKIRSYENELSVNDGNIPLNDAEEKCILPLNLVLLQIMYNFFSVLKMVFTDSGLECSGMQNKIELREKKYVENLQHLNINVQKLENRNEALKQQNSELVKENLELMNNKMQQCKAINEEFESLSQQYNIVCKHYEHAKRVIKTLETKMKNLEAEKAELNRRCRRDSNQISYLENEIYKFQSGLSGQLNQSLEMGKNFEMSTFFPTSHSTTIKESMVTSQITGRSCTYPTENGNLPNLSDDDRYINRFSELQKRNKLCLPHLRTCYPVETQVYQETFSEEAIKDDTGFDETIQST